MSNLGGKSGISYETVGGSSSEVVYEAYCTVKNELRKLFELLSIELELGILEFLVHCNYMSRSLLT